MPEGRTVSGSIDKLVGIADGATGWLVFNNPARRNAVSRSMWEAIPAVVQQFEDDPTVKVVVLTGAGRKAFVSGADISEFEKERRSEAANDAYRRASGKAGRAIAQSSLPTIAMIRGACIGGGLATALNCDIRIASDISKFGIPAARLGIGYPFEGIRRLVSLVGPAQTKQIMFTASHYPAAEAKALGLINEVVADGALEARVAELATIISENAPLSIAAAKLAVDQAVLDPDKRDLEAIKTAVATAMASDDIKEGHRAFMEKRKPEFKGS